MTGLTGGGFPLAWGNMKNSSAPAPGFGSAASVHMDRRGGGGPPWCIPRYFGPGDSATLMEGWNAFPPRELKYERNRKQTHSGGRRRASGYAAFKSLPGTE